MTLIWSLKETFGMFQKEKSHVKMGFSKFYSLRPENVLLQAAMPQQVCLCQYHDNVKMLCEYILNAKYQVFFGILGHLLITLSVTALKKNV